MREGRGVKSEGGKGVGGKSEGEKGEHRFKGNIFATKILQKCFN